MECKNKKKQIIPWFIKSYFIDLHRFINWDFTKQTFLEYVHCKKYTKTSASR